MKKYIFTLVMLLLISVFCFGCSKQGIIKSVSTSDCIELLLYADGSGLYSKNISGTITVNIDEKYDGKSLRTVLKYREGRLYPATLYDQTKEISTNYSFSFDKTVDGISGEVVKGNTKDFSLYIYDGEKLLGTYKFNISFGRPKEN